MSTEHEREPEPDVLAGAPLSDDEQAKYAAWAERIEREEYTPESTGEAFVGEHATTEAGKLLDSIVGAEALEQAIRRGRPSLGGRAGTGSSPKRQVRLPRDLDAALVSRAAEENRKLSEVMRDAIESYLRAS